MRLGVGEPAVNSKSNDHCHSSLLSCHFASPTLPPVAREVIADPLRNARCEIHLKGKDGAIGGGVGPGV